MLVGPYRILELMHESLMVFIIGQNIFRCTPLETSRSRYVNTNVHRSNQLVTQMFILTYNLHDCSPRKALSYILNGGPLLIRSVPPTSNISISPT